MPSTASLGICDVGVKVLTFVEGWVFNMCSDFLRGFVKVRIRQDKLGCPQALCILVKPWLANPCICVAHTRPTMLYVHSPVICV